MFCRQKAKKSNGNDAIVQYSENSCEKKSKKLQCAQNTSGNIVQKTALQTNRMNDNMFM